MKPLSSIKELESLRDRIIKKLAKNENKVQVKIHLSTCGISSGAAKTLAAFEKEIKEHKLQDVIVSRASCIGLCDREPTVTIIDPAIGKTVYWGITEDKVPDIVDRHLIHHQVVSEFAVDLNSPRFKLQEIRILRNQDIDPLNIEEYIARGGYLALAKALSRMTPDEVLEEIKKSGLRGRGGAGFPTATKWSFVRNAKGDEKYVVCNGDEGDPGAYINRAVLEGNPRSILHWQRETGLRLCQGRISAGYSNTQSRHRAGEAIWFTR